MSPGMVRFFYFGGRLLKIIHIYGMLSPYGFDVVSYVQLSAVTPQGFSIAFELLVLPYELMVLGS